MAGEIPIGDTELRDEPWIAESSLGASLKATYDLSNMDSTVSSLVNLRYQDDLKYRNEPRLSPEELNKQFPDMPEPFSEYMNRTQAAFIYDRNKERERLNLISNNGPSGGFYDGLRFATAMVPHALDPVDALAGLGIGKVLGMAVQGTRAAVAFGRNATRLQKLGVDLAEGFAGNVAVEPFVYLSNQKDLQNYTAEQSLINATAGAVGFAGLKYGIGKGLDKLKSLGEGRYANVLKTAGSQAISGEKLDLDLYFEEKALHLGGDDADYSFIKATDAEINSNILYVGSKVSSDDLNLVKSDALSRNLGEGVYITDNKAVANNMASFGDVEMSGAVVAIQAKDLKTADLDDAVEYSAIQEAVELATGQKFEKAQTLGDVVDSLKGDSNTMAKVHEALKELGYDGYRWVGDNFEGVKHSANNQLMVFNKDKLQTLAVQKANLEATTKIGESRLAEKRAEKLGYTKDSEYDPKFEEEAAKNIQESIPELDGNTLSKEIDDALNEAMEMRKQVDDDPELDELIADLQVEKASLQVQDEMVKAATVCFTKGA